jgi:hypothetical protein
LGQNSTAFAILRGAEHGCAPDDRWDNGHRLVIGHWNFFGHWALEIGHFPKDAHHHNAR